MKKILDRALREADIVDIHTHLYAPCFGDLLLWGIDELLTYHYLVAEAFRRLEMPYADFWNMPKRDQADLVWKTLFVDASPVSEACRGVLTVLERLGLDVGKRDLKSYRKWFAAQKLEKHLDRIFEASGVREVAMTNDPFDDRERPVWLKGYQADPRFKGALRIDPLLLGWDAAGKRLKEWGYAVEPDLSGKTIEEVQRFLREWAKRVEALYGGVSLPPEFTFPEKSLSNRLLEKALLPVFRELNLPFAMMIGVKRRANPELALAGDSVGRGKIESVEALCARFPRNKFMVTMLSRENQQELCVAARKFRNLLPFGCWWFVNVPGLIEEITRMRLELLGTSFIPQHSDARVFEQVVYKWEHSKKIIGGLLHEKYAALQATGWTPTEREIRRDVEALFGGNFREFLAKKL